MAISDSKKIAAALLHISRSAPPEMVEAVQDQWVQDKTTYTSLNAFARAFGQEVKARGVTSIFPAGGKLASVAQGLTWNSADEAIANIRTLFTDVSYEQALAAERVPIEQYRGQYPGRQLGLEIAGGVVGPGAVEAVAARGLGKLTGGSLVGKLASEAIPSAVGGGLEGYFGSNQSGFDAVPGAATGVAVGGALGGGVGVLGGYQGIRQAGRGLMLEEEAQRMAQEAVEMDMPLAAGRERIQEAQELGKPFVIGDVGPSAQGQTAWLANMPSRERGKAQTFLQERLDVAAGRIQSDLDKTTSQPTKFFDTFIELDQQRKAAADDAYLEAYAAVHIPFDDRMQDLLGRPSIKKGWVEAQKDAADKGEPFPQIFVEDDAGNLLRTDVVPDLEAWDKIKRGLDTVITDNTDTLTRKMNGTAKRANDLRVELLTNLDMRDKKGLYAAARNVYAGPSALMDAMTLGQKLFTSPKQFDVLMYRASKLETEGEREAFRNGIAGGVTEALEMGVESANLARNLTKSSRRKKQMRQIFPEGPDGDAALEEFMKRLDFEMDMHKTGSKALSGSRTAPMQEEGKALVRAVDASGITTLANEPVLGMARMAVHHFDRLNMKMSAGQKEKVLEKLTGIMTNPDPAAIREALDTTKSFWSGPKSQVDLAVEAALRSLVRELAGWAGRDLGGEQHAN